MNNAASPNMAAIMLYILYMLYSVEHTVVDITYYLKWLRNTTALQGIPTNKVTLMTTLSVDNNKTITKNNTITLV